jgi:hypothetical protein
MTRTSARLILICLASLASLACNGEELHQPLRTSAGQRGEEDGASGPPSSVEPLLSRPPVELGSADMVGAADLDGDGLDEVVLIRGDEAWLGAQSWKLGGRTQRISRGDIDGDGDEELLLATGVGRDFPAAPITIWALHQDRAESLYQVRNPRNQATDLQVVDGRPLLSIFVDDKEVQSMWLNEAGAEPMFSAPMAMQQRWIGDTLVIGRLYGDAPRSHGSLHVQLANGDLQTLPSLRGIRALAGGDLDGDGNPELLVSDGWHFAYGEHGDARLVVFSGPPWEESRTIAWLQEDYSIRAIEVLEREEEPAILVTGSHAVYLLTPDSLGWRSTEIGKVSETGNAVVRMTAEGPMAVISGEPALQISLGEVLP